MSTGDSRESPVLIQIRNDKVFRAYLAVFTVALKNSLEKFAESAHKSSPKEKSGGRKTRRCLKGIQIPYHTPSSFFFWLRVFLRVNFCGQTPGTQLNNTVQFQWWGYRKLPFWGLAEVRFLFYLKLIWKYLHVYHQKKTCFGTPPAKSETKFVIVRSMTSITSGTIGGGAARCGASIVTSTEMRYTTNSRKDHWKG
jgi:hypothetical protein